MIFKGQWKNVDYWPETKDEGEEMGREHFQFFDESILGDLDRTTRLERLRRRAAAVKTITSEDFRKPSDWVQFLEELPDAVLKSGG